jgi:ADP-ribose pyrophosphatase
MRTLFFYGTLRDMALLDVVLGRPHVDIDIRPARLTGWTVSAVKGADFPFIHRADGGEAPGIVVSGPTPEDIDRLVYYEGAYLYGLVPVEVWAGGDVLEAEVFASDYAGWVPDGPRLLERWMASDRGLAAEAAKDVMAQFGKRPAEDVLPHYRSIRDRAQARMNAAREGSIVALRRGFGRDDVKTLEADTPYLKFFALEEQKLTFRRFDGTWSDPVERAVFVTSDVATVLPYDPVTDRVLLVEQFRCGPYFRGDRHPWCLEPAAGRCDAGEDPETTARRELVEETGVAAKALFEVARYYPSPGPYTEYVYSYVAIADLSGVGDAVGGLVSESENIRSMTLSFADFMATIASGEAETAPLILSAYWLERHRDRLRAEWGA